MTRRRFAFPFLVATICVAACSPDPEPAGCRSDAQCPAAARCQASICVADRTPVATIRPLAAVEAFALVRIDGSDSGDPDGDDTVTEHVWTIRSLTAPCDAPEVAGRQPIAHVRFGCPGWYEVSLAVRDALGVESSPATSTVEVVSSTNASVVTTGPDLSTDHACTGDPLVCRPIDPISLSASTTVPGLALRWTVEPPPDRPLDDGTRRVRLAPGTTAATPAAWIETDGVAISGDWIFRVEARDAYGVVGAAHTRVSIHNRSPVLIMEAPAPFPHAFHADAGLFTSFGAIAWSVHDPDGDPIEVEATWRHVGDGGARFDGELEPGKATFAVEVPYATPADALLFRGGPNLARTLELVARDPSGGAARAEVAIEIDNRPPQPAGGNVDAGVRHTFDPLRSRYVADVRLGAWVDPDGDPLSAGPGTAPCEAVRVMDGVAHAECVVPFEGVPAVDRIAGVWSLTAPVRDPWESTPSIPVHRVEILNSPPILALASARASACVTHLAFQCGIPITEFFAVPSASDPDGDPLVLDAFSAPGGTASPNQALCTTGHCPPFRFVQPQTKFPCEPLPALPQSRLRASDGAAAVEIDVSPIPTWC